LGDGIKGQNEKINLDYPVSPLQSRGPYNERRGKKFKVSGRSRDTGKIGVMKEKALSQGCAGRLCNLKGKKWSLAGRNGALLCLRFDL
jgi:hypothetical protein